MKVHTGGYAALHGHEPEGFSHYGFVPYVAGATAPLEAITLVGPYEEAVRAAKTIAAGAGATELVLVATGEGG